MKKNIEIQPAQKRLILTPGFKGGVGKTVLAKFLADFAVETGRPLALFDGDPDNKGAASFSAAYNNCARVDVRDPTGLDAIVDALETKNTALIDLGAGKGKETFEWFNTMYDALVAANVKIVLVAPLLGNAASVTSLLAWAEALQDRVSYVVALNSYACKNSSLSDSETETSHFRDWFESGPAQQFQKNANPSVIRLPKMPLQTDLDNQLISAGSYLRLEHYANLPAPLNAYSARVRIRAQMNAVFGELKKVESVLFPNAG